MAFQLTNTNKSLSEQINVNPQAILQIEGLETVFGVQPVLEFAKWDSNVSWDDGTNWDGFAIRPNSEAVIDLDESGNSITQQILPDKGGSSSVSSLNVALTDLDNRIAQLLSFNNAGELLGKKADFYIGFKQAAFPEDSIPVFRGVIVDFYTEDGIIMLSIAHPETLKRQTIYQQYQSNLDGAIDDTVTTITVVDTTILLPSQDVSTTFIRIDDEVMQVSSIDSSTQLTVVRAVKGTVAASHDDDAEILSIYNISDDPINTALKLMLSDDDNSYFSSDDLPKSINFVSIVETRNNSIIFDYYDIAELTGLVVGDSVRLTGVNAGTYTIKALGTLQDGSFIDVEENLTTETEFAGTFEYRSQYNVLPDGLGMLPNNVDIASHLDIQRQFPTNFVDYSFDLKETIDDVKAFIDEQVYFPQGLYTINRKARSSVKIITPPFSSDIVPTINLENIIDPDKVKQRRSLHKYLYNIIRFDYNEDILEDRFLTKDIIVSNDSLTRIKGGKRQLKIESKGLVRGSDTTNAINQISQRMIDRYKFAPTYFEKIQIKYSDGFNLEVGDVLPFGGNDTKIVNLDTGTRGNNVQLFEVINKSLNIKTGQIDVTLLSTSFAIDSRAAVVSLASACGLNSTTTRIELVNIVDVEEFEFEADKWEEFAGLQVRIYKNDYTEDETVTFTGIDAADRNFLLLETALSFTPGVEHIIEIARYDNTSAEINSDYKLRFAHFGASEEIVSAVDGQIFDVNDASKLLEGSKVVVSSDDFTDDSFGTDFIIQNITGNTITLDSALPFVPAAGYNVRRSDFLDGGEYYGII